MPLYFENATSYSTSCHLGECGDNQYRIHCG